MTEEIFDLFWEEENAHFFKNGKISPSLAELRAFILDTRQDSSQIFEYETNDVELRINKMENEVCATHMYRAVDTTECISITRFLERIEETGTKPFIPAPKRRKGFSLFRFVLFGKD